MIKVSIVVPVYNVEKYLRQCIDSIKNQTLKDIEIICVDDGSTDNSGKILDEYAEMDNRIKVIHKKNSGYGHSMNIGFDAAQGEYIGIVESDDYADLDMFESLFKSASENNADFVKSEFYFYYSNPTEKNIKQDLFSETMCNRVFCPTTDIDAKMEMVEFFNIKPTIWSAIYKRDFIRQNKIRFNETPGASFQDASFNFKVLACAQRVKLYPKAFLHYRQDNEGSSVNSKGKVFCVCDEYDEMQRFLDLHPEKKGKLECIKNRLKYDTYMWNLGRISSKFKYMFLERMAEEFREDEKKGNLEIEYFECYKWNELHEIMNDPVDYYTKKQINRRNNEQVLWEEIEKIRHSYSYRIGLFMTYIPRMFVETVRSIKKNGIIRTTRYIILAKIFRRKVNL